MATIKSVFGPHAENLQVMVDSSLNRFSPTWFQQYFDFGVKQTSLTYSGVIGRQRIEAAASVIARGSASPLRNRAKLEKYSGTIPAISQKFNMDEEAYRDFLSLQAMNVADATKKSQLMDLLFNDVRKAGDAAMKRLDIMVLQGLSTGEISLDINSNPDGLVLGDGIDLLLPAGSKTNAAVAWSTSATATPITDIENVVQYQRSRGVEFEKILMSEVAWQNFRKCTEVRDYFSAFLGKANNKVLPTLEAANDLLRGQRLPIIEIVSVSVGIEKDGVMGTLKPFADDNISFVPAGKLGKIHNAIAIEELKPVSNVAYASYNNALISKWQENEPFNEYTKVELNAFPGFDAIDSIHILSTTAAFV
jgi:hypothetical protein